MAKGLYAFIALALVFFSLMSVVVIRETRADNKRYAYCMDTLHGFITDKGGRTYCVDRDWKIIATWDQLEPGSATPR